MLYHNFDLAVRTKIDAEEVVTSLIADTWIRSEKRASVLELVREYLATEPNQEDVGYLMDALREAAEECWDYLYDLTDDEAEDPFEE